MFFPNDDIAVYAVVARLWGEGLIPYRDVVDHKPPLIYLFFRASFWLGDQSARPLYQAYSCLIGVAGLAMVLAFRSASLPFVGISLGVSYALFYLTDPLGLTSTAFLNTELLASGFLAFTLASLVVYRRKPSLTGAFVSGLLFGCAIMAKQPSMMFGLACAIHLATTHLRPISLRTTYQLARGGGIFLIGTLVPLSMFALYFWWHGALADFILWSYTYNLEYSGMHSPLSPLRWGAFVEHMRFLWTHLIRFVDGQSGIPYVGGSFIILALLCVRRSWLDAVACAWLVSGVLATALNLQGPHSHYYVFFQVPLALAFSVALDAIIASCGTRRLVKSAVFIVLFVTLFASDFQRFAGSLRTSIEEGPPRVLPEGIRNVVEFMDGLEARAGENRRIFFRGTNLAPLFHTSLIPTSKYIYPGLRSPEILSREWIDSCELYKPKVALIGEHAPDNEFDSYIRERYEPVGGVAGTQAFVRKATP